MNFFSSEYPYNTFTIIIIVSACGTLPYINIAGIDKLSLTICVFLHIVEDYVIVVIYNNNNYIINFTNILY